MILHRTLRARSWRNPYLAPVYAFVASFLLSVTIAGLASPPRAEPAAQPTPPIAASPPASVDEFQPAGNGRPTIVIVPDPQHGLPPVDLVVLQPEGNDPHRRYIRDQETKGITGDAVPQLDESMSIIGKLVCVSAHDGFSVSAPAGTAKLIDAVPLNVLDRRHASCQGGWSEPLAVPAELTFFVRKN